MTGDTYGDIEGIDIFGPALTLAADDTRSFEQIEQVVAVISFHWPANECLHRGNVAWPEVRYLPKNT